jgi:anti-anti-sigma factor
MHGTSSSAARDGSGQESGEALVDGRASRVLIKLAADAQGMVVTVGGELDLETAPMLDRALADIDETQVNRLLIDLRQVSFMDSTGLSSILRAQRLARSNGHALVLRRGSRQVQRLFQLAGVAAGLTFVDG